MFGPIWSSKLKILGFDSAKCRLKIAEVYKSKSVCGPPPSSWSPDVYPSLMQWGKSFFLTNTLVHDKIANDQISMNFAVDFHSDIEEKGKVPSRLSISSFEPPSMATGVTRAPSHFCTSLYQLRTRLEGETTMALSISGLASGLWRSRVHRRVIHCKVFPRPISSAMMQPYDPEMRLPVTHSHKNFTPSRK